MFSAELLFLPKPSFCQSQSFFCRNTYFAKNLLAEKSTLPKAALYLPISVFAVWLYRETKRLLHIRVLDHRTKSESHMYNHINHCETYQSNFFEKYRIHPEYANHTLLRENIFEHFEIMERNLQNKKNAWDLLRHFNNIRTAKNWQKIWTQIYKTTY